MEIVEKDRIINYQYVMEFMQCGRTSACNIIKKANELARKDGVEVFISGKTTLKYFYKCIGIVTEVK